MFSDDVHNQKAKAKVQNDALVISLADAKEPTIWRFELDHLKDTAFSIKDEEGQYVLVKSVGKSKVEELGRYFQKNNALEALHSIHKALGNSKVKGGSSCSWTPRCVAWSIAKFFGILVAVYVMVGFWMIPNALNNYLGDLDAALSSLYQLSDVGSPVLPKNIQPITEAPSTNNAPITPSDLRPGEPMDVDALFGGQ